MTRVGVAVIGVCLLLAGCEKPPRDFGYQGCSDGERMLCFERASGDWCLRALTLGEEYAVDRTAGGEPVYLCHCPPGGVPSPTPTVRTGTHWRDPIPVETARAYVREKSAECRTPIAGGGS